jgi:hypothetical protein
MITLTVPRRVRRDLWEISGRTWLMTSPWVIAPFAILASLLATNGGTTSDCGAAARSDAGAALAVDGSFFADGLSMFADEEFRAEEPNFSADSLFPDAPDFSGELVDVDGDDGADGCVEPCMPESDCVALALSVPVWRSRSFGMAIMPPIIKATKTATTA